MIVVSGTKRSGTSMWMQILQGAGFHPIGAAFPGKWRESIEQANPGGFYESRLRDGIFHATNPIPETHTYLHPDTVRSHVVKVFPFGVRRSHRAFLDRVVVTMRSCADYIRSRARLYAMEEAHRAATMEASVRPVDYVPAHLEWFFENLTLLGDLRLRRLPHRVITYDRALRDPDAVRGVLRWLGGDVEGGVAAVQSQRRTQEGDWPEDAEVPMDQRRVFDRFYRVHDLGEPVSPELLQELLRLQSILSEPFHDAQRAQSVDQRRWRQEILGLRRSHR